MFFGHHAPRFHDPRFNMSEEVPHGSGPPHFDGPPHCHGPPRCWDRKERGHWSHNTSPWNKHPHGFHGPPPFWMNKEAPHESTSHNPHFCRRGRFDSNPFERVPHPNGFHGHHNSGCVGPQEQDTSQLPGHPFFAGPHRFDRGPNFCNRRRGWAGYPRQDFGPETSPQDPFNDFA